MAYIIPTVLEKTRSGEVSYDLYSMLLKNRIIFLHGEIDMSSANIIVAQLLYLELQASKEDISMYVNSPGGEVGSGLAILDTMNHVSCDISTIAVGETASMASILLAGGTKGKRFALPNSTIMIHQPVVNLPQQQQVTDVEIEAKESARVKKILSQVIAKASGQKLDKVMADMERNYWMDAKAAKDYGIIDKILS